MTAKPTYEEALRFMSNAVLYQNIDLGGPWEGWKIRGQYLVTPQKDRIPVRELVGMVVHYRAKFRHQRANKSAQPAAVSNVVPFRRVERVQGANPARRAERAV